MEHAARLHGAAEFYGRYWVCLCVFVRAFFSDTHWRGLEWGDVQRHSLTRRGEVWHVVLHLLYSSYTVWKLYPSNSEHVYQHWSVFLVNFNNHKVGTLCSECAGYLLSGIQILCSLVAQVLSRLWFCNESTLCGPAEMQRYRLGCQFSP